MVTKKLWLLKRLSFWFYIFIYYYYFLKFSHLSRQAFFPTLKKIIFNRRIVAPQCCVSFHCKTTWIRHKEQTSPASWASLPPYHPSHPRLSQSTELRPVPHSRFLPAIHFTRGSSCTSVPLSQLIPPFPSPMGPQVHSSWLSLHSCPAHRFISTIFSRFHIYVLICDIRFSREVIIFKIFSFLFFKLRMTGLKMMPQPTWHHDSVWQYSVDWGKPLISVKSRKRNKLWSHFPFLFTVHLDFSLYLSQNPLILMYHLF